MLLRDKEQQDVIVPLRDGLFHIQKVKLCKQGLT